MSAKEWGVLQPATAPVPEPEEVSDATRRAMRSTGDGSILDDYEDNDHLSVSHNGENWVLPGGDEPGESCGEWRVKSVCDECGDTETVQQHCDRWLCPDCWTRVANRFSINAAKRIQAFRSTQPANHKRQWGHAVVSPTEGDITTRRALFESRTDAADIAVEKGFRGCAVVAHSHSKTELGDDLWQAHVDRDEDGEPLIGFWVWLRNESGGLDVETDDLIKWKPHYHIVGPTSPGMDVGRQEDDWVYHMIRFNEHRLYGVGSSEDSHRELFSTFRYLSSHILQPEDCNRQMITWHGQLANSVFVEDATQEWQVGKPRKSVVESIKNELKDIAGPTPEDGDSDGSGGSDDDLGECLREGCSGRMIGVWDIRPYLDQNNPPPDVARKMQVVRDWVAGEIEPPAGLKGPRCERDVELALDAMM